MTALPSPDRPRILVANDDGIFSPGIKALALALADVGDVVVVAPDVEQSAVGHGITIRRPLRFKHTASAGFGTLPAYRVDGTPADCVVLGVHLLGRPDLVVSGINLGSNLGDDLTHSGTVAAAIEGLALGLPSIAFSQQGNGGGEYSFTAGAAYAARLARAVLAKGLPPRVLLNVNFPAGLPRGVRITKVGEHRWEDSIITRHDPEGREYHWVAGQSRAADAHDPDTDYGAVQAGYVSVTPVRLDLTARDLLGELAGYVPEI
ncbi:3'-nucleotidase / 5'-nucleotidase [Deinococcus geothermalis DSM 11300]|uniref:5'-nucleotidase SurE n=1 Tax=Deinococcus geothermalis (strain DSM 11300 / CIP 105573 / AG-3a) TaxID=319795 RepID=SURE_DEIGD|nr:MULTISPECIES: 5'/3'-nucleotidase SurE [Deinococcus]Q1J2E1.1 RecName: Full=5'-nucleotidase SurE; AltName: Full=Nucleoside 5'-monophosphate phosphohydrolase [Deinococcus geothermalis DSM 11300]ABF44343.1 3'-nucleotidase / 5'-nucleotidase [Deinococcus geothermalis DSM 11300]MBI0445196.1 5'/3'-nucleotidase SurE [Deinococcus sp. DB0503]